MEALATELVDQGFRVVPMVFMLVVMRDGEFVVALPRTYDEGAMLLAWPYLERAGFSSS